MTQVWGKRPGKFFPPSDPLARPSAVVVVLAPGHSCHRLPQRRTEWYHQRSVSLFPLVSGISSAGAGLFPGYNRGVRLAGTRPASAAAQAGSLLGRFSRGHHLGSLALYSAWSAVPYFGGVIAVSVILTPMFNSARGSLLIAYLYHFQIMNPIFPDAQPWDNLLFALAAVVIVALNRHTMFKKGAGVTDVLMPEQMDSLALETDESLQSPLSSTA